MRGLFALLVSEHKERSWALESFPEKLDATLVDSSGEQYQTAEHRSKSDQVLTMVLSLHEQFER